MDKFKIALQLYTVRDDLEKDFKATLLKVKEMGYEGVEFAGLYGHSADEVKAMCDLVKQETERIDSRFLEIIILSLIQNRGIIKKYPVAV